EKIIECYEEAGCDAPYISSKLANMKEDKSKYHTFADNVYNLDRGNKARLAKKLGVSQNDLNAAIEVFLHL
ncbi:hypothetical protein, partial [Vibrio aestuarianus]